MHHHHLAAAAPYIEYLVTLLVLVLCQLLVSRTAQFFQAPVAFALRALCRAPALAGRVNPQSPKLTSLPSRAPPSASA